MNTIKFVTNSATDLKEFEAIADTFLNEQEIATVESYEITKEGFELNLWSAEDTTVSTADDFEYALSVQGVLCSYNQIVITRD